jgi:hypothetical protein
MLVFACTTERDRPAGDPPTGVHPSGILDETSENFHGKELARRGYDLALCASCHGDDFKGGKAGAPCTTCHTEGPTACVTCHGEQAKQGHFDMPSPDLPKLLFKDKAAMAKFKKEDLEWMAKEVKPTMAKLLSQPEFTPDNPKGIGCQNCHTTE